MAEASVLILFFTLIISFVSMIVLAAAANVLKGWKRGAAIVLSVLSGLSFALQLVILLAVLALAGALMKLSKKWHWLAALGVTLLLMIVAAIIGVLVQLWFTKMGWFG